MFNSITVLFVPIISSAMNSVLKKLLKFVIILQNIEMFSSHINFKGLNLHLAENTRVHLHYETVNSNRFVRCLFGINNSFIISRTSTLRVSELGLQRELTLFKNFITAHDTWNLENSRISAMKCDEHRS